MRAEIKKKRVNILAGPVGTLVLAIALFLATFPLRAEGALGHWETDPAGLPVFVYTMDEYNDPRAWHPTSQGNSNDHWHLLGNGRMVALAYNHGEVVIYSGERGATWLNERDPQHHRFAGGYGFLQDGDTIISMRYPDRPAGCDYERRFGIGYFEKTLTCPDLKITQTISAPPGEITALVSRVEIENLSDRPRDLTWYEYWDVNPHYFGTMIEIAGEGGESTGEGEGLSSATPMLEKVTKLFSGQYTLSRLVARTLHSWRDDNWKNFSLTTQRTDPDPYLIAILKDPKEQDDQTLPAKINRTPPRFFLTSLDADTTGSDIYGADRRILFDAKGNFTARPQEKLFQESSLKKSHSCLVVGKKVHLNSGGAQTLKFAVGYLYGNDIPCGTGTISDMVHMLDMITVFTSVRGDSPVQDNMEEWRDDEPAVKIGPAWLDQEMLWHAYYLKAMATYDDYFENRVISQGCSYQYMMGLNIAARDPLQHMLPMVYLEPDLARDTIRYTLRMMDGKGFIPYGIKGVGMRTAGGNPFPSDTILYLMLSLTEYVTATRDFGFLSETMPYYPKEDGAAGPVMEHMKKGWRHFRDDVGVGANGLVKLRNSDWNDSFIAEEKSLDPDLDLRAVEGEAESVLNTAMAVYILPRFAALVRSQGDAEWADEIDAKAEAFKTALQKQWNGRWYNRAILPNGKVVGSDRLYLSLQPWAIIGNALSSEDETALDETIHRELSSRSPLGAVMRWPPFDSERLENNGTGTNGGVWYSLRFPLIMAYARLRPDYAWDEFIKMTNHAHAQAYPDEWVGQWSGPDAYNAPNSKAPGWTTDVFPFSGGMMDFPIMCGHAHAAPWFALLKLMGIHPDPDGYTIAPRVPRESFSLKTELIELERGPGFMKGALTPRAAGAVVWRVETPHPPTKITVNGSAAPLEMLDGRAVFTSACAPAGPCSWEVTW